MRLRRVSDWPETPGNRLSGPFSGGFSLPLTRSLIQRFRRSAVVSGGSERASGYSLAHCRFTSRPPVTHYPAHWLPLPSPGWIFTRSVDGFSTGLEAFLITSAVENRTTRRMMGRRILFERGDRLEELLEQLAGATRLLERHDRGSDDDALAEAVVQLLIAEETLTRAVDDLLEEAVVHGGESLRGLAARDRAGPTGRRPHHARLPH